MTENRSNEKRKRKNIFLFYFMKLDWCYLLVIYIDILILYYKINAYYFILNWIIIWKKKNYYYYKEFFIYLFVWNNFNV